MYIQIERERPAICLSKFHTVVVYQVYHDVGRYIKNGSCSLPSVDKSKFSD